MEQEQSVLESDTAPGADRPDRVRAHTAEAVLRSIDEGTVQRLEHYAEAEPQVVARRLDELDREWDTDRAVELDAAVTGLVGLALGMLVRRTLLIVPTFVGGAMLMHAVTGLHPLLPVLRRGGLRSAREIERERYALKTLRGDFENLDPERFGAAAFGAGSPHAPRGEPT